MCDPATIGTLIIASTVVSAAGAGFTALQANASNRYQAKVADRNASLANEAARTEQEATRQEAAAQYRRIGQIKGQQRVAMAANGLDINFGNAGDVQADTDMLGGEDVSRIYDQGAQRVRGFNIEAGNYRASAQGSRQAASGALVSGVFNMAGTALGGATQYGRFRQQMGIS